MAAFAAQPFFQHHVGHGIVEAFASFSYVKDFLCSVKIHVARIAVSDMIDIFDYLVLNLEMALVAIDFVLVDMFCVHEVGVIVFFQSFLFPVAFVAVLPRDFTITEYRVAMTFIASKSVVKDQCMIITGRLGAYEGFFGMTVIAAVDLGIILAFLEVTDKTGTFRDIDVFALDDL
jgi:hypothetical protein